uniref:G-protein coupled receptors family 1 profile domain-containing protein n=1 Tax=Pseudonaja textilis TaxID=8673 RepID=A0A670ZC65_PSETE
MTLYEDYEDYPDLEENAGLRNLMHILSMVIYSIAFLLGVAGNSLVIFITGFHMKRTVNAVWFLNLAIADLVFTSFLPLSVAYIALGFHWPFGKLLCKLISTVAFLNMFASVFLLTVISMDRCVSVTCPVWAQNHRTPRLASLVALGIWIASLALSCPYFVFRDLRSSPVEENTTHCYNNFALSESFQSEEIVKYSAGSDRIWRTSSGNFDQFREPAKCEGPCGPELCTQRWYSAGSDQFWRTGSRNFE